MIDVLLAPLRLLTVFLVLAGAGTVASFFSALSFALVRPFSLANHRRIVTRFSYAFLQCGAFLLEHWARIRIRTYGAKPDPNLSGLCLVNHCSNVDWLVGLAWFSRFGYPYPGNVKAVVKESLGGVPIFGWVLRFSEFVFLARSWAADRDQFLAKLASLSSFRESGHPLWLVLYPEGSRLTPEKLAVSHAYAAREGLPVLQHTLLPRLKGFAAMLSVLRPHLDTIYDATVLFEGRTPSMSTVMSGTADTITHVHLESYPITEIPGEEAPLHAWLLARWTEKDARIARFKADPKSVGEPIPGFSKKPSVAALYLLFSVFWCAAAPVLYAAWRVPNGLRVLLGVSALVVAATALFVVDNLRNSRKADKSRTEKSKAQ